MDELTCPAIIDPLDSDAPTEKRVPTVTDDIILADMGRMNGRRQLHAKIHYSPAPMAAAITGPSWRRSLRRRS
ncbi:hypothetical protein [Caenispirillum salinarum]|uniref:hypothetical protein n=1 Tax=Caenispirillum salinarum TaxID=859058 RepID=UPI003850133B